MSVEIVNFSRIEPLEFETNELWRRNLTTITYCGEGESAKIAQTLKNKPLSEGVESKLKKIFGDDNR